MKTEWRKTGLPVIDNEILSMKAAQFFSMSPSLISRAGALVLIPFLICFAATAWQWGIADIHATQAQSYIKSWRKSGKSPDDQEWGRVRNILVKSLEHNPGFPPYLEVLGNLDLSRSLNILLDDAELEKARLMAFGYFHDVAKARPAWPYGWADILWIKSESEDYDEEFFHALNRTMELGSWESKIQRIVANAGFSAWPKLDEATKQTVLNIIEQSLRRQPNRIIEIANFQGSMEIICPLLTEDRRSKYCQHHQ